MEVAKVEFFRPTGRYRVVIHSRDGKSWMSVGTYNTEDAAKQDAINLNTMIGTWR